MSTYVIKNAAGDIEMWDAQPFPGSTLVDYDVVRGLDGRPYKAGEEPVQALSEVQAAKRVEINAGFDLAMTASLTMPSASPNAFSVYQAIETWKTEDPEGFNALLTIHTARRDSLLASVDAATTPEAVQSITISYAV